LPHPFFRLAAAPHAWPIGATAYRLRNPVVRPVGRLKRARRVATCRDKTAGSRPAIVQLVASRLRLRHLGGRAAQVDEGTARFAQNCAPAARRDVPLGQPRRAPAAPRRWWRISVSAADSVNETCTLRIELCGSDPLIWRQVEVPTSITLKVLHDIIRAAMGWFDHHLWEFTIGRRRFGLPMDEDWGTEPRIEVTKVRLREVLMPRKATITYVYDFGDDWEHRPIPTNIRQGEPGIG
jgi:hypothetical protein